MICPYCFTVAEPAPAIFGEGGEPCSPPHCIKPSCCADCCECGDWFHAIIEEEGKVEHPKAVVPAKPGNTMGPRPAAPPPPIKKPPEGEIPW